MKRILYCLMTLLMLGLTTLPCAADSNKDIEARVSKMTEAEMREELHHAEAHLAELEKALKSGNYSKVLNSRNEGVFGDSFHGAFVQADYNHCLATINAIKRRLKVIDSQRMKEEQERKKKEMEAIRQQEELRREIEEAERRQKELQESIERKKAETEKMYKNLSKFVQTSNKAVIEGNEALERTGSDYHPDFESMPQDLDMSLRGDQQQDASDEPSDISGLFGGKRTKSEQTEGDEEEPSEEDIENQKAALQEQEDALQKEQAELEQLNEELKKQEAQLLEQQAKLLQLLESLTTNKHQPQPNDYELDDDDEPSDNNNKSDKTKKTNKGKKNKNNRK